MTRRRDTTDGGRAHELLRRAARAGKADGFSLRDLCPRDASNFLCPLEKLLAAGLVERVVQKVGVWFYRLTEEGVRAAEEESPPVLAPDGDDGDAE